MRQIWLLTLLISCMANGQDAGTAETSQEVHVFDAPQALKAVQPRYPRMAAQAGKEGYVVFNFMVAEDGTMYEPVVIESLGPKSLETASLNALEKIEWEPARLNGVPVEGGHYYKFRFIMAGDQGARLSFVRKYKKFTKHFSNKENEEASTTLQEMRQLGDLNFYEIAYLNIAEYQVAKEANDSKAQLDSLVSALMYENKGEEINYLPEEYIGPLRVERFRLEVEHQLYAEALETYELIKKSGDAEAVAALEPAVNAMLELKFNDQAYAVSETLPDGGFWFMALFKQAFFLDQVQGQIYEIKLRCQAKYVFFAYTEDAQYNIPASWGKCDAEIVGVPETTFRLVQLSSEI